MSSSKAFWFNCRKCFAHKFPITEFLVQQLHFELHAMCKYDKDFESYTTLKSFPKWKNNKSRHLKFISGTNMFPLLNILTLFNTVCCMNTLIKYIQFF